MSYIIPARFFKPLEKEDLSTQGWLRSPIAREYFLENSLTDEQDSGIWIRQYGTKWIITDCNYSEHRIIHEGTLTLMELINLTRELWKS